MPRTLTLMIVFCLLLGQRAYSQYWVQKGGSLNVDEAMDVVVDPSGNSYATGYFTGTATFGSTSLTSSGSSDIFVVKINNVGQYQWAVRAGGSGTDRGLSIALDDSSNVVITGYYNSTANFGTLSLTAVGQQDIFVAKYNSAGAIQWVQSAGGSDSDIGSGIAVDNSNNIVITGEFKGSSSFGTTTLSSQNSSTDVFISKLASGGTFLWTQQGSGDQTDRGIDVGCDASGNIYATGQFSDTFSFDVTHNNTMFNAVYLTKFNASGAEQWFRVIGGATSCFAYAVDVNSTGNVFITGDFSGTLTFFNSSNTVLNNTYDNGIFIAKYSATGATLWAGKSGSDNAISSRAIAIDASGNVFITGHFECSFSEYSDEYGSAAFNSIGYNDIFVAKFGSTGSFVWSRNLGSRNDDYGFGIDVNSSGKAIIAGSFKSNLVVPTSNNFLVTNLNLWNDASCTGNNGYCSDPNYGKFHKVPTYGNSDAFIGNCIDNNRSPLDYYVRNGSGCDVDTLPGCINAGCPDTVSMCNNVILTAIPPTCQEIGPEYVHLWSNNTNLSQAIFSSSGYEWYRGTTHDGCFTYSDTTYVNILPKPTKPFVEDDVVVNSPTPVPFKVDVCLPDSVTLTGSNFTVDSVVWYGPGLPANGVPDSIVTVTETGIYLFMVVDENGCSNETQIHVEFFTPLDSFSLKAKVEDTVIICENEKVEIQLYDTVDNPNANTICFTDSQAYVATTITYSPSSWVTEIDCETFILVTPSDTGWFYFEAMVVLWIPCDTDTHYVTDSVYIIPVPAPEPGSINVQMIGSEYFCPGESVLQYGTGGGSSYYWTGPFITGTIADSVYISTTGNYTVSSTIYDTNSYGCVDSVTGFDSKFIKEKPQPQIDASGTVICPNGVVWLFVTNSGASEGFHWEGPSGPIPGDTNAVAVSEPGTYYCVVNDEDSCDLTSNSILLTQYTTPGLEAGGDLVICDGDSVTLMVISSAGSEIEWLPPLSGSGTEYTVHEPGTYTCKITSCGIITYATIEVFPSYVESEITYSGVLCLDSSLTLYGTDSMHTYQWNANNTGTDSIVITQPGTYILTTTDSNGCMKVSDPVTITIDQEPTAITISGYPVLCFDDTMWLYGNENMVVYRWSTGDTTQNILIEEDGTYALWAKDSNGCRGASAPIKITTPDTTARFMVSGDLQFCEGDSVRFRANKSGMATYLWLPDSVYGRTVYFDTTGKYWLLTTDTFGCDAWSEPVNVFMQPFNIEKPRVKDTLICEGNTTLLVALVNIGTIQWSDRPYGRVLQEGMYFQTPHIEETTNYYLWSDHLYCRGDTAMVKVETEDCYNAFIPNVFTPNGDGSNEYFTINLHDIRCFHLTIYNRWGVEVFQTRDVKYGWDGTYQLTGEDVPEGTYYYVLKYCRAEGSQEEVMGFLSLIRE